MPTRSELDHDDPALPPWRDSTRREEYDALADLFLAEPARPPSTRPTAPDAAPSPTIALFPRIVAPGDRAGAPPAPSDAAPPVASRSSPVPEVEGLILGHLPVAACAWASQHGAWRAATLGGPVALVRASAGLASVDLIGHGGPDEGPPSSDLGRALDRAVALARRVLIRLDATDEPGLVAHRAVTRLSLLTSADEPATLAAYRTLKSILAGAHDEGSAPEARVVFLGSDGAGARRSGEKIRAACATFLDRVIEWEGGPERIAPAAITPLHRGSSGGAERLLDDLAGAIDRARARVARSTPAPLEDFAVPAISPAHERAERRDSNDNARLASLFPALRALPLRCPLAPGVEFAADDGAVLHALHEAGPRAAEALLAAHAWAKDNWATILLAAGAPGAPTLDERPHVRLHAIGDRFDDLHALLGTPIHAHLRAPPSPHARAISLSPDGD